MKARVRRWHCRAMNLWPFSDYVFAPSRSEARTAFFNRFHVYPFDISPA